MAKNDASAPEDVVPPSPPEATPPRKRARKVVESAAAAEPTATPGPRRRSKAAVDLAAAPATSPKTVAQATVADGVAPEPGDAPKRVRLAGLRNAAGRVFAVAKRPKVAIIGGAILIVGLNAWMAVAVDGWKSEDADLRSANAALGQDLADARATNSFQKEQLALFTSQQAAAAALADELEPVASEHRDTSDALKAAGVDLRTCVNDRGTLIANLWTSTASAQAGLEAEVNAECDAAQAKFKAIGEDD